MLRVVFTVALAVALLAVAVPAVDQAGVHRSDAQVKAAVTDFGAAARHLAESNPALPPGADPARRTVTVTLPTDGFASAPLRNFTVGAPPESDGTVSDPTVAGPGATRFTWRVAGGSSHTTTLDGIRIRPATAATTQVDGGGEFDFLLELVSRDGTRVVRLSRAE